MNDAGGVAQCRTVELGWLFGGRAEQRQPLPMDCALDVLLYGRVDDMRFIVSRDSLFGAKCFGNTSFKLSVEVPPHALQRVAGQTGLGRVSTNSPSKGDCSGLPVPRNRRAANERRTACATLQTAIVG